jgi:hypothetical protein
MRGLAVGERVRVKSAVPTYEHRVGRIVQVTEPFVQSEQMKDKAFREMPLYTVRLDDGKNTRFRGRDLEVL